MFIKSVEQVNDISYIHLTLAILCKSLWMKTQTEWKHARFFIRDSLRTWQAKGLKHVSDVIMLSWIHIMEYHSTEQLDKHLHYGKSARSWAWMVSHAYSMDTQGWSENPKFGEQIRCLLCDLNCNIYVCIDLLGLWSLVCRKTS